MIRKILIIAISVFLAFAINVMAENTDINTDRGHMASDGNMRGSVPPGDDARRGEQPPEGGAPGDMPMNGNNENNVERAREPEEHNESAVGEENNTNGEGIEEEKAERGGMHDRMPDRAPSDAEDTAQKQETAVTSDIISFAKTYSTPITALILLAFAFVFVLVYKRKRY